MAYISIFTGEQIDEVIKLFNGKWLDDAENGILKKNSNGTYGIATWSDIPNKPTTLDGYGITDAHITNGVITLGDAEISVPVNTSDLINDDDFRTGAQVSTAIQTALSNGTDPYQTKSNVDTAISVAVSSAYKYKGSVATQQNLPSSGNVVGDVYDVQDTGMNYAWNGTVWDALGQYVDLSVLATKSEVTTGLAGKQDTLVSSTNIKTINNQSLLGSGNIDIQGGGTTVQSDWNETDTSSAAYILNKPTIPPQLTAGTGITIDSNNVISVNLVNAETQSF